MPVAAMDTRKIPEMSPVANTDPVSRNTQNVTANHTVMLMTETTRVLSSTWRNVRSGPARRSGAGAVFDMAPPDASDWSASCGLKSTSGQWPSGTCQEV